MAPVLSMPPCLALLICPPGFPSWQGTLPGWLALLGLRALDHLGPQAQPRFSTGIGSCT